MHAYDVLYDMSDRIGPLEPNWCSFQDGWHGSQKGQNFFPEMILAERCPVRVMKPLFAGAWSMWRSSDPRTSKLFHLNSMRRRGLRRSPSWAVMAGIIPSSVKRRSAVTFGRLDA